MGMNRRGIFFSLSALMIVGLLILTLRAERPEDPNEVVEIQVLRTVDRMDSLIEDGLPVHLRGSVRQALTRIGAYAVDNPFPDVTAVENAVTSCLTGGACGSDVSLEEETHSLARIASAYEDHLSYEADIALIDMRVRQISADTLRVTANYRVDLADSAGIAIWEGAEREVSTLVRIEGLPDPFYTRLLRMGDPSEPVHLIRFVPPNETKPWSASRVLQHARQGTYVIDSEAPSFLERYTATPGTTTNGIHALLPPGHRPLTPEVLSSLDYQYTDPVDCHVHMTDPAGGTVHIPSDYTLFYDFTTSAGTLYTYSGAC